MGMESQSKLNKLLSKRTKKKPDLVLDLGNQFQKSDVPTLPKRNGDVILYPVDSNGELILSPRAKKSAVSTQAADEFSRLKGAKSNAKVSTSTDPPEIPRRHLLGDFNKATGQKTVNRELQPLPSHGSLERFIERDIYFGLTSQQLDPVAVPSRVLEIRGGEMGHQDFGSFLEDLRQFFTPNVRPRQMKKK
ncbi:hypothetical protein BgiBS90_027621 [Biomphalaria glabrata]|nr:hypothetical protein BgiBS90_027621 [Biomphalaria glabrata]